MKQDRADRESVARWIVEPVVHVVRRSEDQLEIGNPIPAGTPHERPRLGHIRREHPFLEEQEAKKVADRLRSRQGHRLSALVGCTADEVVLQILSHSRRVRDDIDPELA